jgi:hypothetical protein
MRPTARQNGQENPAKLAPWMTSDIVCYTPGVKRPCCAVLSSGRVSRRLPCALKSCVSSVTNRKSSAAAKSTARFVRVSLAYGCVWMGCTIARIAGKPVTSPWLKTVAAETQKISMQFDADLRLAAAAGAVARYFADAAGLDNAAVSELQSQTVAACRRELEQLREPAQRLQVTLTRSSERIDVVVSRPGAQAAHLTKQVGEATSRK